MSIITKLIKELEEEAQITRKMLNLVPEEKYEWQPHERSMKLSRLASHIAELPGWIAMALTTDELDFQNNPYTYPPVNNNADLLEFFEESLQKATAALHNTNEAILEKVWILRSGEQIFSKSSKYEVVRMALAQQIHHRAQLGVFLRLLEVPIPGSYGPSADDPAFN